MSTRLDEHFATVIKSFAAGRVIPFLGAGVNMCGRPEGVDWQRGQYLPTGKELAEHLAKNFGYSSDDKNDLVRVSQYVSVMSGLGPLYEELHGLFNTDYPPTPIHRVFAGLPALLKARGYPRRPIPGYELLIITTNYDDLMERAFLDAGQPFDLLSYEAEGDARGKFWHLPPDGSPQLVEKPNEYAEVSLDKRPVIVKIHGAVDRVTSELEKTRDSYVITEDQYIDYLTRTDISTLLPVRIAAELKHSHFLFLGYSLLDWNVRVILHRIWGQQRLDYTSWAVQRHAQALDERLWSKRGVEIMDIPLEYYSTALEAGLAALGPPP
jgi:SIR2-like protein